MHLTTLNEYYGENAWFLGVTAELRKMTIRFVTSRLSVRPVCKLFVGTVPTVASVPHCERLHLISSLIIFPLLHKVWCYLHCELDDAPALDGKNSGRPNSLSAHAPCGTVHWTDVMNLRELMFVTCFLLMTENRWERYMNFREKKKDMDEENDYNSTLYS
jgi:hypothetical protein